MTAPFRLTPANTITSLPAENDNGSAQDHRKDQAKGLGKEGAQAAKKASSKAQTLAALGAQIRKLEDRETKIFTPLEDPLANPDTRAHSGVAIEDQESPLLKLSQDGLLHSMVSERHIDYAAATRALLALLQPGDDRPILWVMAPNSVQEHGLPYGPGLAAMGVDPARILLVRPRTQADALWALEEGLTSGALAACLGDCIIPDLTQARRLSLATRQHSTACLLLSPRPTAAGAAHSQWYIKAQPSPAIWGDAPVVDTPCLKADLLKKRASAQGIQQAQGGAAAPADSSSQQLALPFSLELEDPNRDTLFPTPLAGQMAAQASERNHATHRLDQPAFLGERKARSAPRQARSIHQTALAV